MQQKYESNCLPQTKKSHFCKMNLPQRKEAFVNLGSELLDLQEEMLDGEVFRAHAANPWFTFKTIIDALQGIAFLLKKEALDRFCDKYVFSDVLNKKIGVVMAGNIPAVGFHDVMCVLLSGADITIKLSSQDTIIMMFVLNKLFDIEPAFKSKVDFVERIQLDDLDGIIATGSDNTARYFEEYFSRIPNLIRKNRSSVAVLTGNESDEELLALGEDMFQYYGMGCRNVSKLLVPKAYNMVKLLDALQPFEHVYHHSKYENNYTYYKSIFLVNGDKHLDTGYALFKSDERLVSPVGVFYYQEFEGENEIGDFLSENALKIQCVVGQSYIPFGKAQSPEIDDYADGVDTVQFVLGL